MQEGDAIAKLKGGDIGGLEVLVRLYQAKAYDAAYLITRNHAQAEDVVQAAFLRAFERIHQLHNVQAFGPWFLRSVVNSALSAAKSRFESSVEVESVEVVQIPALEPSLEEMLEAAETKGEILAALERLSPDQRAAVVMRYYFDWSDAEVARRLEIPAGTVRRRLHDARRRLRQLLPSRFI
jgi:RNA polymerase sigma-70 factor (ECF subfamily)